MQSNDPFSLSHLDSYRRDDADGPRTRHAVFPLDVEDDSVDAWFTYSQQPEKPLSNEKPYDNYKPRRSNSARNIILCLGIAFLVILSLGVGTLLLMHTGSADKVNSPMGPYIATAQLVQPQLDGDTAPSLRSGPALAQDISEGFQNVQIFYFQFTTGTQVQSRQRYPSEGGIPNITIQSLVDYNVCCSSQEQRFVCAGGTAFTGNGMFMEAYLEKDQDEDDVYLLLWINSDDLIEVGCWLKGTLVV